GRPRCCESRNEFNFPLTFNSFSILNQLDSQIAAARRARRKVDEWLKKQENTFLKEINRQMGRNYTSFSTAQREYFKFYEGGKYGNLGPIARSRELSAKNGVWSKNWRETARTHIQDYTNLNNWIECGYCTEYYGFALNSLPVNSDYDSGPGPRFYANSYRSSAYSSFGKAFYTSGLNKSRSVGLAKMVNEGNILKKISDLRVADYRRLGWQAKVFQMSAYLISSNTNCRTPQFSCLPSTLSEYKPRLIWNDSILLNWSKEYSPVIPRIQFVFSDEYMQQQINLLTTGSYGVWSRQTIIDLVERERKEVADVILKIPEENKICGGIRWSAIGDANYTMITGLRLISRLPILGQLGIGPTRVINLPNICIQIPNFDYDSNGNEIRRPSHVSTTRLKLAWEGAVNGLALDEELINILEKREPTDAEYGAAMVKNLNLVFQGLRLGSTASLGYCRGARISVVRYCN
ncbi:hypothetical protein, partial [Winogradskyella sp.]|uniref:hypothetical protein n=1 Tax=Winogradskyella sp. TaxID=1883156 RepID=UPI0026063129